MKNVSYDNRIHITIRSRQSAKLKSNGGFHKNATARGRKYAVAHNDVYIFARNARPTEKQSYLCTSEKRAPARCTCTQTSVCTCLIYLRGNIRKILPVPRKSISLHQTHAVIYYSLIYMTVNLHIFMTPDMQNQIRCVYRSSLSALTRVNVKKKKNIQEFHFVGQLILPKKSAAKSENRNRVIRF